MEGHKNVNPLCAERQGQGGAGARTSDIFLPIAALCWGVQGILIGFDGIRGHVLPYPICTSSAFAPEHGIACVPVIFWDWGLACAMGAGGGQGCMRREGASKEAPGVIRQAVAGGCQSGWGRLLSVTNAVEAGTWRQGDSGWAYPSSVLLHPSP